MTYARLHKKYEAITVLGKNFGYIFTTSVLVLSAFTTAVAQEVSLKNSGDTCTSAGDPASVATEGAIRYNAASNKFEVCDDANAWVDFATYSGSGGGGLWSQNGSEIYYNTANVGIGITDPAATLHVNSTGNTSMELSSSFSNGYAGIFIDTTGDSSTGRITFQKAGVTDGIIRYDHAATSAAKQMIFDVGGGNAEMVIKGYDGNVGVGTTNPAAKVHIDQDANADGLTITGGGGGKNLLALTRDVGGAGSITFDVGSNDPKMTMDNGTANGEWTVGVGDSAADKFMIALGDGDLYTSEFFTIDASGNVSITGNLNVDGSLSGSGLWSVSTTDVYRSSGSVGIGTDSPDSKFHVLNSGTAGVSNVSSLAAFQNDGTTGSDAIISLISGISGQAGLIMGDSNNGSVGRLFYDNSDNSMQFLTAFTERMRINSDGNVGIGTTSPSATLHLIGASGALTSSWIGAPAGAQLVVHNNGVIGQGAGIQLLGGTSGISSVHFGDSGNGVQGGIHYDHSAESMSFEVGFDTALYLVPHTDAIGRVGVGTNSPESLLHVESTGSTELTIEGGGSGYHNGAVVLKATNGTNVRALGTYAHDAGGDTEWFWGRPYNSGGGSDRFVVNRQASVASHAVDTAVYNDAFLTILNDGRMGVGLDSPSYALDVSETGTVATRITAINGGYNDFTEVLNTAWSNLVVKGNNNGYSGLTIATPNSGAQVGAVAFGDEANGAPGYIAYGHSSDVMQLATNGNIFMTADSSGNVGIGTTGPNEELHVNKTNVGGNTVIRVENPDTTSGSLADFYALSGSTYLRNIAYGSGAAYTISNRAYTIGVYADYPMYFRTNTTDRMVILGNGNVGIGTMSPSSTLHVPDGSYAQFADFNAGAPPSADCDADNERGRMSIDTTNNRLYICMGASRGWDYTALTD